MILTAVMWFKHCVNIVEHTCLTVTPVAPFGESSESLLSMQNVSRQQFHQTECRKSDARTDVYPPKGLELRIHVSVNYVCNAKQCHKRPMNTNRKQCQTLKPPQ